MAEFGVESVEQTPNQTTAHLEGRNHILACVCVCMCVRLYVCACVCTSGVPCYVHLLYSRHYFECVKIRSRTASLSEAVFNETIDQHPQPRACGRKKQRERERERERKREFTAMTAKIGSSQVLKVTSGNLPKVIKPSHTHTHTCATIVCTRECNARSRPARAFMYTHTK